jgi:hypothetical protein
MQHHYTRQWLYVFSFSQTIRASDEASAARRRLHLISKLRVLEEAALFLRLPKRELSATKDS